MIRRPSPALLSWVTCTILWAAGQVRGQTGVSIQGRVLDRANLKPVPGAAVSLVDRPGLTAVADAQGLFKIASSVSAVRVPGPFRESPAQPGRRAFIAGAPAWADPRSGRNAAGRENPISYALLRAGTGTPAPAPGKVSAAGTLEASFPGLATRRIPVPGDTADLGDIILDYPPRKLDVGVKPIYGAIPLFDGRRATLDAEWEHWMGAYRIKNGLKPTPIIWEWVADPVDTGMTMRTCCRVQWGDEDLITKRKFRDFQLHVEFNLVSPPRTGAGAGPANSGVQLQTFYEIQIKDDYGMAVLGNHDAGAILNETAAPENLGRMRGQWQAYDITYRAARFKNGARSEKARLTLYWNGKLTHRDKETANEHGAGVSGDSLVDAPKGLKLQSEGHDVRYRNVWIKELDLVAPSTDLGY